MMKKINIFFIHATHLKEREKIINDFRNNLEKFNFKNYSKKIINVITNYDPSEINIDLVKEKVNYDPIKSDSESKKELEFFNGALKNLHIFQVSNCLKHYYALKMASEAGENDVNLILEDDILYEEKIFDSLEKIIVESSDSKKNDLIWLGLPSNKSNNNNDTPDFRNQRELFRVLPYCDSYLINKKTAQKLYQNFLPIKWISNIQFSYLIEKLQIESRIVIPNIFMEGSKFGLFMSSLNCNNQLFFNRDYMTAFNILNNNNEISNTESKTLQDLFANSQISQNPDFIHLNAKYLTKKKQYQEAEKMYKKIFKIYQDNTHIINNESNLLKDYIHLHKFLQ